MSGFGTNDKIVKNATTSTTGFGKNDKVVSVTNTLSTDKPIEEKGFLSKAWENIQSGYGIFGKPEGTLIKQEYKSEPSLLSQWISSFSPTQEEKKQTIKGLQTLPKPQPQPQLTPEQQKQKEIDDVANPFKEFRKVVPDPNGQSDSLNVGFDIFSVGYGFKPVTVQVNDKIFKTAELTDPKNMDIPTLNEKIGTFKQQKDQRISQLKAEKDKELKDLYNRSDQGYSTSVSPNNTEASINKYYDDRINEVEKSYAGLVENVFQPLLYKVQNQAEIENRSIKAEDINERAKELERSKTFLKVLNSQDRATRLKDAAISTIQSENLGGDSEKLKDEYDKYENPESYENFLSKTPLKRESKEYNGIITQLSINKNFKESYTQQKDQLVKSLAESKEKFEKQLQEQVYSKGFTIDQLTPESKKAIENQQNQFKKIENLISLYDENIRLSEERDNLLLSDIDSFKELIDYKSEQDKINRLYEESPLSTFVYSLPTEFGKRLVTNSKEVLDFTSILALKKLGVISEKKADLYLKELPEAAKRDVYVQKLVMDEETGQMVYKNIKDLEAVSIFDKQGNYKPIGQWVENADALAYQIFNTTAESAIIGFSGLLARKGLYSLGRAAAGELTAELGILEAVDASAVGLSRMNKAKLLGLKGLEKGTKWSLDVTSMLPATTFLYSPEMINREIEKGLSIDDVAITASLRLLAETASENLFFDDVKFVDGLLKSGAIKNYSDLAKSEAYRLIMDKASMAAVGRKLTEFEYKSLFTGKGLKQILTKENFKFLAEKSLPRKAKYLAQGIAYGAEASAAESGEEVSTNFFNLLIDNWRQSKDPSYEPDQEFTLENQINTVVQTMATMSILGTTAGYKAVKQKINERKFNTDLASYQVAITPNIYKENLIKQYQDSQKTSNPMSQDELALRIAEIDKLSQVYESLGFSKEKTDENVKIQLEKLKGDKKEINDILKNELEKQAEREVRNTEFQMFRDALTKTELQNAFLSAKTDGERDEILERVDNLIVEQEELKKQREEQKDNLRTLRSELAEKEYSEQRQQLSNVVENLDFYIESLETLNDVDAAIEAIDSYAEVTDKDLMNYAAVISTALKNRQYELLSQGATRLTPEKLSEKEQFELNNFNDKENKIIESLGIKSEDVSKVDGKIVYTHEGQPVEFSTFKELYEFKQKKEVEKQEEIAKSEKKRQDLERLNYLQERVVGDNGTLYVTPDGKFGITLPSQEFFKFDTIEELEDYILNPEEVEEDKEQSDLDKYNEELDNLFNEYNAGLKRKTTKEKFLKLKNKKVQSKIKELKQKYNIVDTKIEEDSLAVTFNPLETELSENQIIQVNNIANIKNLSSTQIVYQGDKLVSLSNLISYQARTYTEKTEVDENQAISLIEESTNELNKEFLFLHSPEFSLGQEFTIVVKPFESSEFVESEKETLRKNAKHLVKQGISQEEINADIDNDNLFQEIQIFTKDGKYVGAIHSLSYVRPSRVVPVIEVGGVAQNNLAPNYKALKDLRNTLLNAVNQDKKVSLVLTDKTIGHLSFRLNFENKTVKEAFENKNALKSIQVVAKQSKLSIGNKETINEAPQGSTAIPIITPNGKYFALTLNKAKLHSVQVQTVLSAIQLYYEYSRLINDKKITEEGKQAIKNIENLAKNIEQKTQHNITTPEGLKEYLQLFVNVNSKTSDYTTSAQKEELKNVPFIDADVDSNGNFRITLSNARVFEGAPEDFKGSIEELENIGVYRLNLTQALKNDEKTKMFFSILKEHLEKRSINHSTELSKTSAKFNLPYIKKTNLQANPFLEFTETELNTSGLTSSYRNYKDFLIATSITPVLETKLPDGTYTYFQQPNLAFKPVISEKSKEPTEPTVEEEFYKSIKIIEDKNIKTQTGEIGAAQYDRVNNTIKLNRDLLVKKFEEKAWTKPRKQKDDSFATALDENIFEDYQQWENFVIEHEFQHSLLSRTEFDKLPENKDKETTTGEYEDYINNKALEELGLTQVVTEEAPVEKPAEDIEAKKANTERKIVELQKRLDTDKYEKEKQDILDSLTKGLLPSGFRFGTSIGIIEKYIPEEDRWISVVDNILLKDKDVSKAIDIYFNQQGLGKKIIDANNEYKKQAKPFEEKEEEEDKNITNEQIKLLSSKEGILVRKDWSLGKGLGYTGEGNLDGIVELDEVDEEGNKFEAEYYLTGENDEWIESSYFLGKTKQEVIDKINAKYDAELDALEGKKEEQPTLSKSIVEKETIEQQIASDDTDFLSSLDSLEENFSFIESTITLKNNKEYRYSEVNSDMLEKMGYSPEEIGEILKKICS